MSLLTKLQKLAAMLLAIAMIMSILPSTTKAATDMNFYLKFDGNLNNEQTSPAAVSVAAGTASYDSGVQGQSLHLNYDNYVQLEQDASSLIDYSTSFTVAYWIKIDGASIAGGDPALMGNKNWSSSSNYGWVFNAGDNSGVRSIKLSYRSSGGKKKTLVFCPVTQAEAWTHIAITFDYTNNIAAAYVNGQTVQTITDADSLPSGGTLAGAGVTLLGQGYSDSGLYNSAGMNSDLQLDEFHLQQGALTASDIQDMYNQTKPTFTVTGVAVSPREVRLDKGTSHRFVAAVSGTNDPLQDVTWSVVGGNGTTGIAPDGTLTIDPNETAGALTVTATSKYASVSDSATITVTSPRADGKVSFAVVSDVHVGLGGATNNDRAVKAFQYFSDPAQQAEFLVVDGDLGNGTPEAFNYLRGLVADELTIPLIATMGNHEENQWEGFENSTGSKANDVKIIDGYYFIFLSPGAGTLDETTMRATSADDSDYTYLRSWLQKQLTTAEAATPGKPIFVFFHHPVRNTTIGSDGDTGSGLEDIFNNHPNVVTFSGHIHYPNNDPHGIWQDDGFTAVNTTATCSADLESALNGGVSPDATYMSQGLLVEADSTGNVTIKTRDLLADQWIDNQIWSFNVNQPLPYTGAIREPAAKAPQFAESASISLSNVNIDKVSFNFNQAVEPANDAGDIVHYYQIDFIDKEMNEVTKSIKLLSDFWYLPMPEALSVTVDGLTKSTEYEVRIYAYDAYGLQSTNYLSTLLTTPERDPTPKQLIDFAMPFNGTLDNSGQSAASRMVAHNARDDIDAIYQEGKHNQAVCLDNNHFVVLDNDSNLIDYSQSFTVAFWMNVQWFNTATAGIMSNRVLNEGRISGYTFKTAPDDGVTNSTPIIFEINPVNGNEDTKDVKIKVTQAAIGEWVHLAATFDYANNKVNCYVNGDLAASIDADLSGGIGGITEEGRIKSTFFGSSPWNYTETLGGYNGNAAHDMTFLGDDLVISSCVYTQEKIRAVMNDITARPETHTVTFDAKGGIPAPGPQIKFTGVAATEPAPPTKSGYTFKGWYLGNATVPFAFMSTPITSDIMLMAKWASGSTADNSPHTPADTTQSEKPKYSADVSSSGSSSKLDISVNDASGNAAVTIDTKNGEIISSGSNVSLVMPQIQDIRSYTVKIPADTLSLSHGNGSLTMKTNIGTITLPSDMLSGVGSAMGKQAEISIGKADTSGLSSDVRQAIGDRPAIQLAISLEGQQMEWNNPSAPVTVTIPYTPTTKELLSPESITVWYIDGNGNPVVVPNGHYDPTTAMVTFSTTHFSLYAIGYNKISFGDVSSDAWYSKAVNFISARGITKGTGDGMFSPDANLKRGELLVMMMRVYGISPDAAPTDNFTDAGNTYYTGYLAAAKRLGITAGVGDNMYAPDRVTTRQEMFTLLYKILKAIDKLPQGGTAKSLSSFADAGNVAPWAKDAFELLTSTGTISGNAGMLLPENTSTRAQLAQVLYIILSK